LRRRIQTSIAGRAAVLLAAALLGGTACSPAASPSPSAESAPWQPRTAWERAVVATDENGEYSKDAALTLFATAYGPLPGVDVQQDLRGVEDRTIAIDAVARYRDQLTDEQRAAIAAFLAPPADAIKIEVKPVAQLGTMRLVKADPGLEAAIRDVAEQARIDIASKIGDHDGSMYIYFKPRPADVQPIEGIYPNGGTVAEYDGGLFNGCNITIYDQATSQSGLQLTALMTHEVMHCFQAAAHGTQEIHDAAPKWINEGMATWVGMELGGPSPNYERFWDLYLLMPQIPLTSRSYDAVGFYAHLKESGIDPWGVLRPMLAAGTNSLDAYRSAGADAEAFADSWASGVLRVGAAGSAWNTVGPGITATAYKPQVAIVSAGTSIDLGRPFFTNDITSYDLGVDVVEIQVDGHARLRDGAIDTPVHGTVRYCVQGHDCAKKCPDGSDPPRTDGIVATRIALATSGGSEGLVGRLRGLNLDDELCSQPPSAPPSAQPTPPDNLDPCQSQCAQSDGDVHISTFGDGAYDFQGVGEFVVARSADSFFEVQTRQAPLGNSKIVSINTALAVRAGDHRLAMYIHLVDSRVRLTLDGTEMPFEVGQALPFGSGLVARYPDGVSIDTGDGSKVFVVGMSYRGFNLLVEPGPDRLAGTVGLMGANPKDSRWPALPDGSAILPYPFERHAVYVQLYETLAPAWRVTPETSLFDYAAGESTATFTNASFPAEVDMITLADLTPAQRAAGEAACAGVTDPVLYDMCVFDVGVTSDPGYGDLYETTVQLRETGDLGFSGERVRIVNLYANEGRGTDLDVYAWTGDATNLGTGSNTGPALVATVPYGQATDWFNPGQMANGPFPPVNWISLQRHGEPVNSFQLNLFDLARDSLPGLERTVVIAHDSDGFSAVGGTAASYHEIREEAPEAYFPLIDAPAGKALAFLDAEPMFDVAETTQWVASIGGTCLADPEFPTLARTAQGFTPRPVVVEPGSVAVSVHEFPAGADAFDLNCGRFPAVAQANVTTRAGDRVHLFVYADSASAPVRLLALPLGD
jgi:hypothetical protein